MLKILGRTTSSNVQKVLWLCEELGLAHEREDVGGPFGKNRTPEYLRLNPNGLVPVVIDDGFALWESNTILRYLAAKHGRQDLLPGEPRARSLVERWMDWELSVAVGPMGTVFKQLVRTPEAQRDAAIIADGTKRWIEAMGILDAQLRETPFVAGGSFTVADISLGSNAYRYLGLPLARPEHAALQRWLGTLSERPGYRLHVQVPMA